MSHGSIPQNHRSISRVLVYWESVVMTRKIFLTCSQYCFKQSGIFRWKEWKFLFQNWSKKTEMVCPHLFHPPTQDAAPTSWLRQACILPVVSITAESFAELHPGGWLLAPAGYPAAGDALSMALWLVWATCSSLGAYLPLLPKVFCTFPSPSKHVHPWYSVLFAWNMRLEMKWKFRTWFFIWGFCQVAFLPY